MAAARKPSRRVAGKAGSELSIRRGTARDVPVILELIRGLAEYERLLHQVEATPALIRASRLRAPAVLRDADLPPRHGACRLRALLFHLLDVSGPPDLYLEDLFVRPEERGRGGGKALLKALARIAVARGCGRMEWAVLDWNRPAIRFYKRLGAGLRKEWILTRITGEPLRQLARSAER